MTWKFLHFPHLVLNPNHSLMKVTSNIEFIEKCKTLWSPYSLACKLKSVNKPWKTPIFISNFFSVPTTRTTMILQFSKRSISEGGSSKNISPKSLLVLGAREFSLSLQSSSIFFVCGGWHSHCLVIFVGVLLITFFKVKIHSFLEGGVAGKVAENTLDEVI